MIALGYSQDASARRAYAAAAMVREQSQARLDLAAFPMTWWKQMLSPFRWAQIKADSAAS